MRYSSHVILPLLAVTFPLSVQAQDYHGAKEPADNAVTNPAGAEAKADSKPDMPDAQPDPTPDAMTSWPPERRAEFAQWPKLVQDYFHTLPTARQTLFWGLAYSDKAALVTMPEADREAAWKMAEQRFSTESQTQPTPMPKPMDEQPR